MSPCPRALPVHPASPPPAGTCITWDHLPHSGTLLEPPPTPVLGPFWEGWVLLSVTRSQGMTRPCLSLQAVAPFSQLKVRCDPPHAATGGGLGWLWSSRRRRPQGRQVGTCAKQTQRGWGQPQAPLSEDAKRASDHDEGCRCGGARSSPTLTRSARWRQGTCVLRTGLQTPSGLRVASPPLPSQGPQAGPSVHHGTLSFARWCPPRGQASAARS